MPFPAYRPSRLVPALLLAGLASGPTMPASAAPDPVPAGERPLMPERLDERWVLSLDNDAILDGGRDQDYTGGIGLSLSGVRARDGFPSLDPLLGGLERGLGLARFATLDRTVFHAMQGGLLAFTPADIGRAEVIPGDRPYASLVYLANSRGHFHANPNRITHTSLAVGLLGLSLARNLNNGVHALLDVTRAQGWDHQISHGGEPTLRLRVSSRALLDSRRTAGGAGHDLQWSWSASAGYVTEFSAAMSARWGLLRSAWWSFAPDAGDYLIDAMPAAPPRGNGATEAFLVVGMMAHAQLYNALLQGQFRHSDLRYDFDEIEHVGGQLWGGLQVPLGGAWAVLLLARYQTPELRMAPGDRELRWGTVALIRQF